MYVQKNFGQKVFKPMSPSSADKACSGQGANLVSDPFQEISNLVARCSNVRSSSFVVRPWKPKRLGNTRNKAGAVPWRNGRQAWLALSIPTFSLMEDDLQI